MAKQWTTWRSDRGAPGLKRGALSIASLCQTCGTAKELTGLCRVGPKDLTWYGFGCNHALLRQWTLQGTVHSAIDVNSWRGGATPIACARRRANYADKHRSKCASSRPAAHACACHLHEEPRELQQRERVEDRRHVEHTLCGAVHAERRKRDDGRDGKL
eukprot:130806-Chlamydomonas_euryale.AAC.14